MNILVIGNGGREHALVWKLAQDPAAEKIYCAPGSDGMAPLAERAALDPRQPGEIISFIAGKSIGLTVIGPEAPLVAGLADELRQAGHPVIGPSAAAARLEGSKVFAKDFMARHHIPTARYEVFRQAGEALARLAAGAFSWPVVIKADGLAGGKGVVIAGDESEARRALSLMMEEKAFGASGDQVVLEEFLSGQEISFMVFTDGHAVLPMVPSRDHKTLLDGGQGPNTGGMGAISDDNLLTLALREEILRSVIEPTIQGMAAEGCPFQGILYAGLMLTAQGPKVLEYNVRFGDPETQAILPRLKTSLLQIFLAMTGGRLASMEAVWDPRPAVCVVLAAAGYPHQPRTGDRIFGLDMAAQLPSVALFHAGTRAEGTAFVTSGGRVLGVTARGAGPGETVLKAYEAVGCIHFDGMQFRRDIGQYSGK